MGDRTSVNITVWAEDVDKFKKESNVVRGLGEPDFEDFDEEKVWVELEYHEANYAGWNGLEAAAKAGCRFYGPHGEGGEYNAHEFVSDGSGVLHSVLCIGGDTACIIRFEEDEPFIPENELERLRAYKEVLDKVTDMKPEPKYGTLTIGDVDLVLLDRQRQHLADLLDAIACRKEFISHQSDALAAIVNMLNEWSDEQYHQKTSQEGTK